MDSSIAHIPWKTRKQNQREGSNGRGKPDRMSLKYKVGGKNNLKLQLLQVLLSSSLAYSMLIIKIACSTCIQCNSVYIMLIIKK